MKLRRKLTLNQLKVQNETQDFRRGLFILKIILIFILPNCIYPPAYPPYVVDSRSERDSSEDNVRTSRRSSRRSGRSSGSGGSGSSSIDQTIDEVNRLEDLEAEDYLDTVAYIYLLNGYCSSSASITPHKSCVENCVLTNTNLQTCFIGCNSANSCDVFTSFGSGVFMSQTTILTNHHVIEEAIGTYVSGARHYYNIFTSVENYSGQEALLTAVNWYDSNDDVALIEFSPSLSVDVPTFGRLSSLSLLDELFTIGSPIGVKWTASLGHLTNKNPASNVCENCIIYSIPTFSGSSGGPVYDVNGHLIAIHAFVLADNGRETPLKGGPHIDRIREFFDDNSDTQNQRQEVGGGVEDYSAREQRAIADSVKNIVIQLSQE